MSTFTIHTTETAPASSKPVLAEAQKNFGFVPNLLGVFAESPAMLKANLSLGEIFDKDTSFSPTERQVVLLAAIFENDCQYCMAAHSTIAGMQGVPAEVVQALRDGTPLADPKLDPRTSTPFS